MQKTVLTKISLNSHSTKKRSRFRHPYRFMNLDFLAHFGILVNRSLSSAPRSMTFLTFGTYLVNYCHPSAFIPRISNEIQKTQRILKLQPSKSIRTTKPDVKNKALKGHSDSFQFVVFLLNKSQCSPRVFNCQKIAFKRDIHG